MGQRSGARPSRERPGAAPTAREPPGERKEIRKWGSEEKKKRGGQEHWTEWG